MDDGGEQPHEAKEAGRAKKIALVVIHGMGEQRPMETLWGFVGAAWIRDQDLVDERSDAIYSKPDKITGNFELRRITTRHPKGGGQRVDFFEFYWAYLMTGNTVHGLLSWAFELLFRRPASVPKVLRPLWLSGLAVVVASLIVAFLAWLPESLRPAFVAPWVWPWALALGGAGGLFAAWWAAPVAGDAARYLSPTPDNVAARQAIREAGVDLLTKLHASGEYDRIVVVGHSLGSVIGYDVLNFAWGRIDKEAFWQTHGAEPRAMAALEAVEKAGLTLSEANREALGAARLAYRAAQRDYARILTGIQWQAAPLWLVSDFVTLGSPLSKAQMLLAKDLRDLDRKKALREAPSCPPWFEKKKPPRFSFDMRKPVRAPHHAAVFAPTVWTNLYFASRLLVFGDVIAGPLAWLFGRGVLDVRLPIGRPAFRHLDYWKAAHGGPASPAVRALRRAINLRGLDEARLWGEQAEADEIRAERLPDRVGPSA